MRPFLVEALVGSPSEFPNFLCPSFEQLVRPCRNFVEWSCLYFFPCRNWISFRLRTVLVFNAAVACWNSIPILCPQRASWIYARYRLPSDLIHCIPTIRWLFSIKWTVSSGRSQSKPTKHVFLYVLRCFAKFSESLGRRNLGTSESSLHERYVQLMSLELFCCLEYIYIELVI